jgi:autotransporter-associated beta strand protein
MKLTDSSAAYVGASSVRAIASATSAFRQFMVYSATTISAVISGTIGIIKNGTGTLTLTGANTYTGATAVNAGTLKASVASVANTSGAFGKNSAVTLANTAGVVLDITGYNTQIGSLTGGGATGGNVTLGAATLTTGGDNTSPAAYAGVISGTGALAKIGTGTQILSGTNTYTGTTTINAGTLNLNGVGGTIGSSSSVLAVGLANGVNGAAAGTVATGAVANIGGGNYTVSALQVGYTGGTSNLSAGSGWLTMTGGTITANNSSGYFVIGGENSQPGNGQLGIGQVDLSGNSTINFNYNSASAGDVEIGVRGGRGVLNISGNAALNANKIILAVTYSGAEDGNTRAYVNQSVGTVTLSSASGLNYGTNASGRVAIYNLNGGTLNTKVISAPSGQSGATAVFNFNGGTLQAGAASANLMSNLSGAIVYAGGANIDDGGYAITIGQALTAPTGYGLGSVGTILTPTAAGTGYVNPPNVTFNTPSGGLPATGYATINATTGQVTGIVITSPGSGYTSGQAVTVTLQGGGGGSGATFTSVTASTANGSGGLTKTGTGTLTLTGANTYSGSTSITAGTLRIAALISGPAGKFSQANFTNTTLSITFTTAPLAGETYRLLPGATTQTYASVTLVGATGRTATYNSANSTLTIA